MFDDNEVNMLVFNFPMAAFDRKSAGYPIGGSLAWAQRFADRFEALGGVIHYNTPVKKILTQNNQATGLLVRNDRIHEADIILSAADWNRTVFEYLEGKYVSDTILKLKEKQLLKIYYSILLVTFGLKKIIKKRFTLADSRLIIFSNRPVVLNGIDWKPIFIITIRLWRPKAKPLWPVVFIQKMVSSG
ncbi:MAG: hypothetical protein IPN26_15425 [Bacteroidetes bacterium]|nr:hypothetical protein [Bacteroidota bacterium]